jgi:cytochrome c556
VKGLEANLQFKSSVAALMVVWAGALAMAQTKVTTPEELDKSMKALQQAQMAAGKAITAANFAEAAKQIASVKKALTDSREFWVTHKKDDAIAANKEAVAKVEEVEKMLTAATPDGAAVMAAMKQTVGPACRQCHEKYRVRDAENNWILKPGTI